jgi:hypothetical protein
MGVKDGRHEGRTLLSAGFDLDFYSWSLDVSY